MEYKLFIQVIRDGQPENLFFKTLEELTAKKAELDAELAGPTIPPAAPEPPPAAPGTPPAV